MLAQLTALKASQKPDEKPQEENLSKKFNVMATDRLTKLMTKKLKQDVNIEYKQAKQFMRKNQEGFIALDDLLVYETKKLKRALENKPRKRQPGRSEPPLYARGRNFIDGGPSVHQTPELACSCEICRRELRQTRAAGQDSLMQDVLERSRQVDAFLERQKLCDDKMEEINRVQR